MSGRWRLLLVAAMIAGCAMIIVTASNPHLQVHHVELEVPLPGER